MEIIVVDSFKSVPALPAYNICEYVQLDAINDYVTTDGTAPAAFIKAELPFTLEMFIGMPVPDIGYNLASIWKSFGRRAFNLRTVDQGDSTFKINLQTAETGHTIIDNILTTATFPYTDHQIVFALDITNRQYKLNVDGVDYTFATPITATQFSYANKSLDIGGFETGGSSNMKLYYLNLYEAYVADGDIANMYNTTLGIPNEVYAANLSLRFDSNTIVWNAARFESVDTLMVSNNMIESALNESPECFNPDNIAGMNLWMDATDASTINAGNPVDGEQIYLFADKSSAGNDAVQATSIYQPAYNDAGSIAFSDKTQLQFLSALLTNASSWFIVLNPTTSASNRQVLSLMGGSGTGGKRIYMTEGGLAYRVVPTTYGDGQSVATGLQMISGTIDNAAIAVDAYKNKIASTSTYSGGITGSTNKFAFVGQPGNPSSSGAFRGNVIEIIRYDSVLSDARRQAVENYLQVKHGTP